MVNLIGHIPARGDLPGLDTREHNHIANYYDRSPLVAGTQARCADYRQKHIAADHSRGNATSAYNCHGLTFASRRTGISEPTVIRQILAEDGYQEIDKLADVRVGDVVLYFDATGDAHHSGIVVGKELVGVRVLSKWGDCQEVVHMLADCPYPSIAYEYHRVVK